MVQNIDQYRSEVNQMSLAQLQEQQASLQENLHTRTFGQKTKDVVAAVTGAAVGNAIGAKINAVRTPGLDFKPAFAFKLTGSEVANDAGQMIAQKGNRTAQIAVLLGGTLTAYMISKHASKKKAETRNTEKLEVVQEAIGKHTAAIMAQRGQGQGQGHGGLGA